MSVNWWIIVRGFEVGVRAEGDVERFTRNITNAFALRFDSEATAYYYWENFYYKHAVRIPVPWKYKDLQKNLQLHYTPNDLSHAVRIGEPEFIQGSHGPRVHGAGDEHIPHPPIEPPPTPSNTSFGTLLSDSKSPSTTDTLRSGLSTYSFAYAGPPQREAPQPAVSPLGLELGSQSPFFSPLPSFHTPQATSTPKAHLRQGAQGDHSATDSTVIPLRLQHHGRAPETSARASPQNAAAPHSPSTAYPSPTASVANAMEKGWMALEELHLSPPTSAATARQAAPALPAAPSPPARAPALGAPSVSSSSLRRASASQPSPGNGRAGSLPVPPTAATSLPPPHTAATPGARTAGSQPQRTPAAAPRAQGASSGHQAHSQPVAPMHARPAAPLPASQGGPATNAYHVRSRPPPPLPTPVWAWDRTVTSADRTIPPEECQFSRLRPKYGGDFPRYKGPIPFPPDREDAQVNLGDTYDWFTINGWPTAFAALQDFVDNGTISVL
ncbi:hypothetical protein PENSPDRAFT_694198 [Peniophora sp. CONT]|nr:hypothetical protein PENSPDRAFT_694198 [Peniophora sp. CONT]